MLSMNKPELKKAMTTLEFLSQDREARMRYEARQKLLHDEASLVDSAMAEGERRGVEASFQKGIEQGIEKGKHQALLEMARNMLSLGLDIEVIAKATGLSQEDIRSLS
nr:MULTISPECIES: Rpn family recombination-promoting nuclease/putative transposase [unclassified Paenibacillus]